MVIPCHSSKRQKANAKRRCSGALTTELVIAMAILVTVMLPLAFSFAKEQKLCRSYYYQAVAMQLVDGELEGLAAGEWKAYGEGVQDYAVQGAALKTLPPGRFILTIEGEKLRLEWIPARKGRGGRVHREVKIDRSEGDL